MITTEQFKEAAEFFGITDYAIVGSNPKKSAYFGSLPGPKGFITLNYDEAWDEDRQMASIWSEGGQKCYAFGKGNSAYTILADYIRMLE